MNREELSIFKVLSENDKEDELQYLLNKLHYKLLTNVHNTTGYSALHVACSNNNPKYVQILI